MKNNKSNMMPIGYSITRWFLNRWLRQNPRRVVPLIEELHRFAEVKLTVLEYRESVEAWQYVIDHYKPNDRGEARPHEQPKENDHE